VAQGTWADPDEEPEDVDTLRRVERFAATGGAVLEGRVVDADTGKALAGTSVHAHHAGTFVETHTDDAGAFRIPGMLPTTRVSVWIGRRGDPFVDEHLEIAMPGDGQTAVAGTVRLLRGDELAPRLRGWVGVFVGRRAGHIVVSGVSPWLSADQAGLQLGDQILAVDGRDVTGLGPRAVAFLMRGAVGVALRLTVRTGSGEPRKLRLARVLH
jgi:PDZ domain